MSTDRSRGCDLRACGGSITSMIHTARRSEVRVVRYRWHPFFNKEVLVRWRVRSANGFQCFAPGDEQSTSVLVPSWMFDAEICASMKQLPGARVSVFALIALRHLLLDAVHVDRKHAQPDATDANAARSSATTINETSVGKLAERKEAGGSSITRGSSSSRAQRGGGRKRAKKRGAR